MIERVQYWVEVSEYDLDTAEAMLLSKRYLYVGFMCHQSVEKILKAYYCSKFSGQPPFTHGLLLLAEKSGLIEELTDEITEFIDTLQPLNIEARYPSDKEALLGYLTPEKCRDILDNTKEVIQWIKTRL